MLPPVPELDPPVEFELEDVLTRSSGLIPEPVLTVETLGLVKAGRLSPPQSMATVPVGETEMIFALADVAVEDVHSPSQKVKTGAIPVPALFTANA